jgi:hypothetical protein
MADAAYESQKVQALQALNQTLLLILAEMRTIRAAQQAIAQKTR